MHKDAYQSWRCFQLFHTHRIYISITLRPIGALDYKTITSARSIVAFQHLTQIAWNRLVRCNLEWQNVMLSTSPKWFEVIWIRLIEIAKELQFGNSSFNFYL